MNDDVPARIEPEISTRDLVAAVAQLRADVDDLMGRDSEAPEPRGPLPSRPLARSWRPGQDVAVGDLRAHDGQVWEVVQAHTTQDDWPPPAVPALWRVWRAAPSTADDPAAWQPGIAVTVGETFTYDGTTYDVVQAHTTQVGWEPPTTPALWSPTA